MFSFIRKRGTILIIMIIAIFLLTGYTVIKLDVFNDGFALSCTIETYGNAWNGELAFPLSRGNDSSYLVVMDTNGNLLNLRESDGYGAVHNIANNTLLFQGEPYVDGANTSPTYATHIWNLPENRTNDFPNIISHHDIQYNPINNTFLTLQVYVRTVENNAILYDKIVQVDAVGKTLWTWDTYDHIPLSDAPLYETSTFNGQTVQDFTHANALDWDYNNNIIYLNLRNTNTFYKINQTNGKIIWACGQFGNFTLLDENKQRVSSLWYHNHNVKQVTPNVFSMFDNDYGNNTNPNNCHSSIKEVTLNETSMTAHVSWSWEAPTQYWTLYGGATLILPNGDYLGCFGTPTHQFPQNQPWNFNDTGAVFVEVNPAGEIVRTFTFPVGSYVYRLEALTNNNPFPSIPEYPLVSILIIALAAVTIEIFYVKTIMKNKLSS